MELRKQGIGTSKIIYGGERLGIYFLETGAVARASKVVYDRAHSSIAEIRPGMLDWDEVFKDASWFHWTGITPAISEGAANVCLEAIQAANRLGITVSCDLNYRKKLWKYGKTAHEVMPELVAGCDIILGRCRESLRYQARRLRRRRHGRRGTRRFFPVGMYPINGSLPTCPESYHHAKRLHQCQS